MDSALEKKKKSQCKGYLHDLLKAQQKCAKEICLEGHSESTVNLSGVVSHLSCVYLVCQATSGQKSPC